MDTIFINSKYSKTSEPHRLLLNLSDKIDLKSLINMFFIESQHLLYMEKYKKCKVNNYTIVNSLTIKNSLIINLKYQL